MNKPIQITQDDLRKIVNESVQRILKEGYGSTQLQHVIDALEQLVTSGWIPFASPSPSSTEMVVKQNVMQAIECLKKAQAASDALYR